MDQMIIVLVLFTKLNAYFRLWKSIIHFCD
jgi:hypothetical protein